MARPKLEIDEDQVIKLSKLGCTIKELAEWFGCSKDTLERRYQVMIQRGRSEAKMSLRRAQLQNALGGNTIMQIWLGKQLLGQKENNFDGLDLIDKISFKESNL